MLATAAAFLALLAPTPACNTHACGRRVHMRKIVRPHRPWLRAVRRCESGGDYRAISPDGIYTGAYQFDDRSWHAVGGTTKRAMYARKLEQDYRAVKLLFLQGPGAWPNCS